MDPLPVVHLQHSRCLGQPSVCCIHLLNPPPKADIGVEVQTKRGLRCAVLPQFHPEHDHHQRLDRESGCANLQKWTAPTVDMIFNKAE